MKRFTLPLEMLEHASCAAADAVITLLLMLHAAAAFAFSHAATSLMLSLLSLRFLRYFR